MQMHMKNNNREAALNLDYLKYFGLLCGGCLATNKTSKTAHQSKNLTNKTTSRCYHVRCEQQLKSYHRSFCHSIVTVMILLTTTTSRAWAAPSTAALLATTTPTTTTTITTTITTLFTSSNPSNIIGHLSSINNNNNNNYNSRLRKRHSKRHSNWYDYYNYNENSTILEWANPCGGYYDPTQMGGADFVGIKRMKTKEIFNILKRSVGNEFKTLKGNQQDIDISNIKIWSLHEYTYKFLPKLKMNSSIALKRWYRNTQTYVASFAYLRRIQLKWDHNKRQRESRTARELKHLLLSSRSMLCELETAINSTQPHPRRNGQQQSQPQQPHLHMISRQQMNKRLKLRTKRRNERSPDGLNEADTIDLKFVKYFYYEFLETMWKVLRKNMKRRGQIALRANHKAYNEVDKRKQFGSIAELKSKTEKRTQKRQERYQQQKQKTSAQTQLKVLRKPRTQYTTVAA